MRDHFSARAADYAAFRPTVPPALGGWLAAQAPARGLAWDAGCGSGQFSALLAERFDRVVATDAFPGQIAAAAPHPRIDYRAEPAEACSLADASVDLATACQAAHWFDGAAYAAEVARVARPGAVAALIVYGVIEAEGAPGAALARFHDATLAEWWPPERAHVVDGYARLHFPFDPLPAPAFAIARDWDLARTLGYVDTWSGVKALREAGRGESHADFVAELSALWGDPATPRRIRWPITLRVGRVSPG